MRSAARMASRPSVLVTAGPTREKIDPARFISNYSTGTFGYEIARAARRKGLRVTLISGPVVDLKAPSGARLVRVESAAEMRAAVLSELGRHGVLIMAAAVADWRPEAARRAKAKRSVRRMRLELVANPDILADAARQRKGAVLVGFALETGNLERNARRKLEGKGLDLIVANRIGDGSGSGASRRGSGSGPFGPGRTSVLIMDRFGRKAFYHNRPKAALAKIILDKALKFNI